MVSERDYIAGALEDVLRAYNKIVAGTSLERGKTFHTTHIKVERIAQELDTKNDPNKLTPASKKFYNKHIEELIDSDALKLFVGSRGNLKNIALRKHIDLHIFALKLITSK